MSVGTRVCGVPDEEPIFIQSLKSIDKSGNKEYISTLLIVLHELCGCMDLTEDSATKDVMRAAALSNDTNSARSTHHKAKETIRGMLLGMSAAHESEILIQHGPFVQYYETKLVPNPNLKPHSLRPKLLELLRDDNETREHQPKYVKQTTRVTVTSPPCCRGNQCIGMTGAFRGFTKEVPGVVLMAFIHKSELDLLKKNGTRPVDWHKRACVLCVRFIVSKLITAQSVLHTDIPKGVYMQPWINPAGIPGEYKLECVWGPPGESSSHGDGHTPNNNGLVGTFARFDGASLVAIPPQRATGDLWTISQSNMIQHRY